MPTKQENPLFYRSSNPPLIRIELHQWKKPAAPLPPDPFPQVPVYHFSLPPVVASSVLCLNGNYPSPLPMRISLILLHSVAGLSLLYFGSGMTGLHDNSPPENQASVKWVPAVLP